MSTDEYPAVQPNVDGTDVVEAEAAQAEELAADGAADVAEEVAAVSEDADDEEVVAEDEEEVAIEAEVE